MLLGHSFFLFVLNQRQQLNVTVVTLILTWFDLLRSERKQAIIRVDIMEMDDDTFIDKNLKWEALVSQDANVQFQPAPRKRIAPVNGLDLLRRNWVTVCLGLLCVVLLACNIGQLIFYANCPADNSRLDALTAERTQLEARLSSLTDEKYQLQLSYSVMNISKDYLQTSYNSLQKDKEQLQTTYSTLQQDKEQLQINLLNLTKSCVGEAKNWRDKMLKTAVQIRSMPCQTGWRKFGDSCYILSTDSKDWKSSIDACNAVGADLVSINSRDEQAFINGLLPSGLNAWIGLHDRVSEGTWMWVDGSPFTTTYWQVGQPNSKFGGQDCGEFVQKSPGVGEWNDDGCTVVQNFICEQ